MNLIIDGKPVYAAGGGRGHVAGQPLAVLLHGAGFDHTVWALHSRRLAFQGWNVLAPDLPGHGRSAGPALPSIVELAHWVVAALDAIGAASAVLVGHSMGSLIALEAAARQPQRVRGLVLIGSAAAMPVHPDLLAAAAANQHTAIDMVTIWGFGYAAGLGGSSAPGVWMAGTAARVLEQALPGVLHADLAACSGYLDGAAAAAAVRAPALVLCGEKDQMTPLRSGRALAQSLTRARLVVLTGAGHMLLAEKPVEVQRAVGEFLRDLPQRDPDAAAGAALSEK